MTPEEKAKSLLWKFLPVLNGWTDDSKTELAKKIALITVDEIIQGDKDSLTSYPQHDDFYDYWENVKTEIEKLC